MTQVPKFVPLQQTEAEARFSSINQGIQYRYFYNFMSGEYYEGLAEMTFTFNAGADTFIDWHGIEVRGLSINGKAVAPADIVFDQARISLKEADLVADGSTPNVVVVHFYNSYSTDGNGLVTYTDSQNQQYLYTQTEPYWGNRVCPMFDQPDLKATFELFASGAKEWLICTGEKELMTSSFAEFKASTPASEDGAASFLTQVQSIFGEGISGESKYFRFSPTLKLSTYLNNIVAGPYLRYDATPEQCFKNIPMAVYARQNMSEYAESSLDEVFQAHAKGIEFYEKFFSFDYPFSKCDIIFCCNYTVGAMEYPGAITYNESRYLLKKTQLSRFETSNRVRVILHELAHMWFGNTVTMKWWNDLWLNESFADFCCFQAWEGITSNLTYEVSNGWVAFLSRKGWAFTEDQQRTTHPIAAVVSDTDKASDIFDGITYPKGAMVLRQLMMVMSSETFSKALGSYFKEFCYKNTLLSDLLAKCKEAVGENVTHPALDIDNWQKDWLEMPGMNEITPEWDSSATGETATLTIRQTAAMPEHPTLRYHKICVAFFGEAGQVVEEQEVILNNSEVTTLEYNASLKPQAVILNYKDWSFVKIHLDAVSKAYFVKNFTNFDVLTKALFLRSLYDNTRDAILPPTEYADIMLDLLERETDSEVVKYIIGDVQVIMGSYMSPENKKAFQERLFNLDVAKLLATEDFDTVSVVKQSLIRNASTPAAVKVLVSYLDQQHDLKKHALSLSEKWAIVYKVVASSDADFSQSQKYSYFGNMMIQDKGDTKLQYQLRIKGLLANDEERVALFEEFRKCEGVSFSDQRQVMLGFVSQSVDKARREAYFEEYFASFVEVYSRAALSYGRNWLFVLRPTSPDTKYLIQKVRTLLESVPAENKTLAKKVTQILDNLERVARVKKIQV